MEEEEEAPHAVTTKATQGRERENDPKRRCVLLAAPLSPFLHLLLPTSRPDWSHIRRTRDVHIFPRYT